MHTHCFQDFDAFAGSVRGIDCVMMLQNPRRRAWTISQVELPGVHLQLGRLGSGNIVEGQSFSTGYVLYLPLTDACGYSANGTELDKDSSMICEPGCEFCISTQFEHDWCSIFVPSDKLVGGKNSARQSSGSEKTRCRVSPPNRQAADQLKALVHQVMTAAACCPQFESAPAAASAGAELLKVASVLVGDRHVGEAQQIGRPKASRQQIVRRSKELLEERHGKPIRVEELAAAAQVSERTLRTVFQEYFGVGPVGFLQLRQLHQVHRALREGDREAVHVTDVLTRHGVWNFGRFASRYRRLFGERPLETLRTTKR
jgi:AraC family ethanolamine operon transcriptional activator